MAADKEKQAKLKALQLTLDMDTTSAAQILKLGVDGDELLLQQFDGVETARVLDGANLPSAAGTSTSIASGNTGQGGFGFRKMVYLLGSGNNNNVLTLTANQSGGVIFVTPTNNVGIVLPTGIPGIHYKIVIADKLAKAFTIKTAGAGTEFFETIFPPAPFPFMDNDEKLTSIFKVFNLADFLRCTVTVSASPLGLAVKYITLLPFSDLVKL